MKFADLVKNVVKATKKEVQDYRLEKAKAYIIKCETPKEVVKKAG